MVGNISGQFNSYKDPHDERKGVSGLPDLAWLDQGSHAALFQSRGLGPGGINESSVATSNPTGNQYNQSVTYSTSDGHSLTLANNGNLQIDGRAAAINVGQTIQLAPNVAVTENANDGKGDLSFSLYATGANGQSLTTSLASDGNGVDVYNTAQNLSHASGYLVDPTAPESPLPTRSNPVQSSLPGSSGYARQSNSVAELLAKAQLFEALADYEDTTGRPFQFGSFADGGSPFTPYAPPAPNNALLSLENTVLGSISQITGALANFGSGNASFGSSFQFSA